MNTCPLRTYPGQILGHRWDGRPIYAIAGASPDGDGSARESGGSAEGGQTTEGAAAGGASSAATGADAGQQAAEGATEGEKPQKVEDLPDWAQKLVRDARKEAGDSRVAAKNAETELVQRLGKALGLVKDDEKADPEKLTQQIAAEQAEKRQAKVELAVFRTAGKHQGDPEALLDSRSFLAKVGELDPSAADFTAQVEAAVKTAVKDNPKLKAVQAAASSGVDHGGRPGERRTTQPKSLADAVAQSYGT